MLTIEYLRHFRFLNYAIFDLVLSYVGVLVVSPLLNRLFRKIHIEISWWSWLFFTLPIGILFHLLFNTMTPMTKQFLDLNGNYILKLVMLLCCVLGGMGVRKMKK